MSNCPPITGPFKLTDWNCILTQVNSMTAGCKGVTPLKMATDPHVWTIDDLKTVQTAIKTNCGGTFTAPVDPALWLQKYIDEINAAIKGGCSNCNGGGGGGGPSGPSGPTGPTKIYCVYENITITPQSGPSVTAMQSFAATSQGGANSAAAAWEAMEVAYWATQQCTVSFSTYYSGQC